jgi:hypothetical protein
MLKEFEKAKTDLQTATRLGATVNPEFKKIVEAN